MNLIYMYPRLNKRLKDLQIGDKIKIIKVFNDEQILELNKEYEILYLRQCVTYHNKFCKNDGKLCYNEAINAMVSYDEKNKKIFTTTCNTIYVKA